MKPAENGQPDSSGWIELMKIGKPSSVILAIFPLLFMIWTGGESFALDDMLINAPEEGEAVPDGSGARLSPGTLVILPDGGKTIVESVTPEGNFRTENGLVILPDGSLEDNGGNVEILLPGGSAQDFAPGVEVIFPDGSITRIEEKLPDGDWKTALGAVLAPDGAIRGAGGKARALARTTPQAPDGKIEKNAGKKAQIQEEKSGPQENLKVATPPMKTPEKEKQPENARQNPPASRPEAKGDEETRLTLAELLPMTEVRESEKAGAKRGEAAKKPQTPARPTEPEKKTKLPKSKSKEAPEKKQTAKMPEKQAAPEKKAAKTPVGKQLRIPPEAVKSGNLSFLEGCWQGTRPEYYSKRTIKECFCFGANGAKGKRRVFDPIGSRMCIGSTRAHLAANGVLSVTSSGAACDDGERWGQAEMECKNSGPQTPCSWIFKDANNGRQSYQIPFVRVETCGR